MDYNEYVRKSAQSRKTADEQKSGGEHRSFRYLDRMIHSGLGEIVLDSDIVLAPDEEKEYSSGIKLDVDDFIIDGNGFSIDGKGKVRIFDSSGENVTLKNVNLINGFSNGNGAAVYHSGGLLTIIESSLYGNVSLDAGGAVFNIEGEVIIADSTLTQNISKERYGGGGAVCNWNKSKMTIEKSTLTENRALGLFAEGGAILNMDGEMTITGCVIKDNSAKPEDEEPPATDLNLSGDGLSSLNYRGGAIYNCGKLRISKCEIKDNSASNGAGAIYTSEDMTITKSVIGNNRSDYGGAILHPRGSLKISDCEISDNKGDSNIIFNSDFMEIRRCRFHNNKSENVILNMYKKFDISITDVEFIENPVGESIIYNDGKSCTIEQTVFVNSISKGNPNNIVNNTDLTLISTDIRNDGQSIQNDGHILLMQCPKDLESKITGKGTVESDGGSGGDKFDFGYLDGMIHECGEKVIHIDEDISFELYEKFSYGKGINLDINNIVIDGGGITIDGSGKARIFTVTGKNITLKNITFKNARTYASHENPSDASGGAIKILKGGVLTLDNCRFADNVSDRDGGAIDNDGVLNIIGSDFRNNTTEHGGGAIVNRGKLNVVRSTFEDNVIEGVDGHGGAIYNEKGHLSIIDSTFAKNAAIQCGGAIDVEEGDLNISDSSFTGNTAKGRHGHGGAIYNKDGVMILSKLTFSGNISKYIGGSISNGGRMAVLDSSFTANVANGGGAISNGGELNVSNSSFNMNKGYDKGGAIYLSYGVLNISRCQFSDNDANYSGAVENYNGTMSIEGSELSGNSAQKEGGAIRNVKGEVKVFNSSFDSNDSEKWGGAIYNEHKLTVTGSKFTGNSSKDKGGAIYNFLGDLFIFASTFRQNISHDGEGGAIENYEGRSFHVSGCRFEKNKPNNIDDNQG